MNLVNEGVLPPSEPDDRDERRETAEYVAQMERGCNMSTIRKPCTDLWHS